MCFGIERETLPARRGVRFPTAGGVLFPKQTKCAAARRRRTKGDKPMVSPLLRITPLPFLRARVARKGKVPVSDCHPVRRNRTTFRRTPQNPALDRMHPPFQRTLQHSPQTGCTHFSGSKRQNHLRKCPPLQPLVFLSQRSRYEVGAHSTPGAILGTRERG